MSFLLSLSLLFWMQFFIRHSISQFSFSLPFVIVPFYFRSNLCCPLVCHFVFSFLLSFCLSFSSQLSSRDAGALMSFLSSDLPFGICRIPFKSRTNPFATTNVDPTRGMFTLTRIKGVYLLQYERTLKAQIISYNDTFLFPFDFLFLGPWPWKAETLTEPPFQGSALSVDPVARIVESVSKLTLLTQFRVEIDTFDTNLLCKCGVH